MNLKEIVQFLAQSQRVAGHDRDRELISFFKDYFVKNKREVKEDNHFFRAWDIIKNPILEIDNEKVKVQPVAWTGSTNGFLEGFLEKTTPIKTFEAYEFERFFLKNNQGKKIAFFISRPDQVWLQPVNQPLEDLPGAMFEPEVYKKVINKIKTNQKVKASFKMQTKFFDSQITNLISPAKKTPKIIIAAHYDSVNSSPGANDNATGVASVLKIMEKFSEHKNIEFILFAAEEWNKFGSYCFVNNLKKEEISQIKYFLNFDMTGSKNGKIYCLGDKKFTSILQKIVGKENFSSRQPIPFDAWPFCKKKVPVIQFGSSAKNLKIHSPEDSIEKVDFSLVEKGIDFAIKTLEKI